MPKFSVTGSHIKRSDLEGGSPVIIIDREEIERRGYTSVFEALQNLSFNTGQMFEGPEAQLFTPDVQTVNLRGFGVGQVLVLINGQRQANYPAAYQSESSVFNFGIIPITAVERIEIMTTGASAIYGSDAVAGVINVILRKDLTQNVLNVLWGTPTESRSSKTDLRVQFLNGNQFGDFNYLLTLEYTKRDPLLGRDFDRYDDQARDYPLDALDVSGVYDRHILTLDLPKSAFGIFPSYRDPQEITGRSGDAACQAAGASLTLEERPDRGLFCGGRGNSGVSNTNFRNGREVISGYLSANWQLADDSSIYGSLLYTDGESESHSEHLWLSEEILDLTKPDTIGFGFYDWYLAQRAFTKDELGQKSLSIDFEDRSWSLNLGMRGVLSDDQEWDFSVTRAQYDYSSQTPWFKWRELMDGVLGANLGISFGGDQWWAGGTLGEMPAGSWGLGIPANLYGPAGEALINSLGTVTYANETRNTFAKFTLTGDVFQDWSRPLSYALVVEYEDQSLKFRPDELLAQLPPTVDSLGNPITGLTGSGWYRLSGYQGGGDRQRWGLAGEVRVALLDSLTVNLAGRVDDYDSGSTSFGSGFTPSATVEWRPRSGLLLRAGYSESLRAPDLVQVFTSAAFFTPVLDRVLCLDFYNFQNGTDLDASQFESQVGFGDCESTWVNGRRTGAQDLDESQDPLGAETGENWWIGGVWDITDRLSIQLDYQDLELGNRITVQSANEILTAEWDCLKGELDEVTCNDVATRIRRTQQDLTGARAIKELNVTPVNRFSQSLTTLDVRLFYNLPTRWGIFDFQGDYTNIIRSEFQAVAGAEAVNLRDGPSGGRDFRAKFTGALTWSWKQFSTTLTGTYRGSTRVRNCLSQVTGQDRCEDGTHRLPGSYTTFNWTGQYFFTEDFMARLRVKNLFNDYPPTDDTYLFYEQPWYNYIYSGFGIGREVALEAQLSF